MAQLSIIKPEVSFPAITYAPPNAFPDDFPPLKDTLLAYELLLDFLTDRKLSSLRYLLLTRLVKRLFSFFTSFHPSLAMQARLISEAALIPSPPFLLG